jgi:transglycosylase-like protein with SLT domain
MEPRKELVEALAAQETGGESDPDSAVSSKGAEGRFQIEPATAKAYGYDPKRLHEKDYNKKAATGILGKLLDKHKGDEKEALKSYYGRGKTGKGMPSTDQYADQVLKRAGGAKPQEGGGEQLYVPSQGAQQPKEEGGLLSSSAIADMDKFESDLQSKEADAKLFSLKNLHHFLNEMASGTFNLAKGLYESSPVSYLTKTGPLSPGETAQHGASGAMMEAFPASPEVAKEHPEMERGVAALGSALEWMGWGQAAELTGGAFGAVSPLNKYVPPLLEHVVHSAATGAGIGVAMAAATAKVQGQPITSRDIGTNAALGALLGGLSGAYGPGGMAAIEGNWPRLKEAAGPTGMGGLRDVQRLASSFAREEKMSEGDAMKSIAGLLTGKGDAAMAAKVRLVAAAEPERFRSEMMKKVLTAATGDLKTEHVKVPSHEELADVLGLQGRAKVGMKTGRASEMPRMVEPTDPIETHPARAHLDTLMRENAARSEADVKQGIFSPAATKASRALTDLAMSGKLLPEHVTSPHEADAVAAGVFRRSREEESGGYEFTKHYETGKEWKRRVRELGGTGKVELPEKVDGTSATDLFQLKDALDKDKPNAPTNTRTAGPARKTTKEIQAKRNEKGRLC